jgi:Trk K+ transport system NAD-binding subunit
MTELERSGDVQEIEITAESVVGRTIRDVDDGLPEGCLIALVGRDGNSRVPERDLQLEHGDHITVLGQTEAVKGALERFHPHD